MKQVKELYLPESEAEAGRLAAADLPGWDLTARQLCDLELLLNGGFSPLSGFMGQADYDSVVDSMRLADGTLWPMPITLDVSQDFAAKIAPGQSIALRDPEGVNIAVMEVADNWTPDRALEARNVYGTTDTAHPGVAAVLGAGPVCLGGRVQGLQPPVHYDFRARRDTPNELRAYFRKVGWRKIAAFHTRSPLHRAQIELTTRAVKGAGVNLLIHPVVGAPMPGDIDQFTRVRCYEAVQDQFNNATTHLSLVNLAMRGAGPREALWHALVRKNFGCTHLIVGEHHASAPGFYGAYEAQDLLARHAEEAGIEIIAFKRFSYVQERAEFLPADEIPDGATTFHITEAELRRRLNEGLDIPDWFSPAPVIRELRRSNPPRARQGFTVFFTGFSGSGKSTVANALLVKLMELGGRPVTLLDGDIVRKNLSSELGFSKEHRDLNIRRIGFVASEITKNGGIAICAPIAPYATTRAAVRADVETYGAFVEVHVATSIEECERRDRKGLYKLAREGKIKEFTGISDPYDVPETPELRLDTEGLDIDYCAHQVLLKLEQMGLVAAS